MTVQHIIKHQHELDELIDASVMHILCKSMLTLQNNYDFIPIT